MPEGWNEFEFLQQIVRNTHNKIVREAFKDLGGDDWEPDYSTMTAANGGRAALRHACTHKDNDSEGMTQFRLWLFYMVARKARDLQAPVYAVPYCDVREMVFKPQVKLYFSETRSDKNDNITTPDERRIYPLDAEISFRVMNETSSSFTKIEAERLAKDIKRIFAAPKPYRFKKGRTKVNYRDEDNGYRLSLLVFSESEGKEVINKVLDVQKKTIEQHNLTVSEKQAHELAKNVTILGKTQKTAQRRPIGYVTFRYAALKLYGLRRDLILVDASGRFPDALERA